MVPANPLTRLDTLAILSPKGMRGLSKVAQPGTLAVMVLCFFSILAVGSAQEKGSSQQPTSAHIGLPVGVKAPAFALRDQFDRAQSNETLRGAKGTILLFFRSADW